MTIRNRLRGQLYDAWCACIKFDYARQRINSERSLQASFWSQLNQTLPAKTRRLFIEPRVSMTVLGVDRMFYPDVVVCNSRTVIAVIELKYQPRALPIHDKDLNKLELIAANREELYVANERFRGTGIDSKSYSFSEDVLFVWAGVHRAPKTSFEIQEMLSAGIDALDGCFLQLHAETYETEQPKVFYRANWHLRERNGR